MGMGWGWGKVYGDGVGMGLTFFTVSFSKTRVSLLHFLMHAKKPSQFWSKKISH